MTYKGDTGQKKWARLETYFTIRDTLGARAFQLGRHLFICGPDAADARVLAGLGVPLAQVTGIDRDASAARSARLRFPDLDVVKADVLDYFCEARMFSSVNLDFCAQLTDANLTTAGLVVTAGLAKDGVIAITFLAGREQPNHDDVHEQVTVMRKHMQRAFKNMPPAQRELWKPMLPALSRFWVLQRELVSRTRPSGKVPVPKALYFYKSRQAGEPKGMPMCVYVAQVKRCARTSGDAELTKALETPPEIHFIDPTSAVLGRRAMVLETEGYDPCALFDVTKAGLAAWKANATRKEGK